VDSHNRLHAELIAVLRQHCLIADKRHLVLLSWLVAGLLLSQIVNLGVQESLLRGGVLHRLPWPGHSAALADP